jgi:hypothetical protein
MGSGTRGSHQCDGARSLSQVLRWQACHIIRLWDGRLATSSSHCRTAFLCRCLVLDGPNTPEFLCISLELRMRYTCIWALQVSSLMLIKSILGHLTKSYFNLQKVTFFHLAAARSSLVVLSLGWSKGFRQKLDSMLGAFFSFEIGWGEEKLRAKIVSPRRGTKSQKRFYTHIHIESSTHCLSPPNSYSYVHKEHSGSTRKFTENYFLFLCITNHICAPPPRRLGWKNLSKTADRKVLPAYVQQV